MADMEFNGFEIQWVAFAIAIVAILMAMPGLLQRIYGAPEIAIRFGKAEDEGYRFLTCEMINVPITKGLLGWLRVRREPAQDVVASFQVREEGTNRIVCPWNTVDIKTEGGVLQRRVELPASWVSVEFVIVDFRGEMGKVNVCKGPKEFQPLPMGAYKAEIKVTTGNRVFEAENAFVVSDSYPLARWGIY